MTESVLDKFKKVFLAQKEKTVFVENMIFSDMPPHTVKELATSTSGRTTSVYYFCARYLNEIAEDEACGIISEFKKLQDTDKNSHTYGCMRWYREETFIRDTNGAFFVLFPVILAYKFCSDKMTENEKNDIKELLHHAVHWFNKECAGRIFYTNKILSDGAIFALISDITGEYKEEAKDFWTRWINYANNRGWGWGETSSDCYSNIILNALNALIISNIDAEIKEGIIKKRDELVDYMAFHQGKEFVPSIRTYNFTGDIAYGGSSYRSLKSPENAETYFEIMDAILMIESKSKLPEKSDNDNVRYERLFDSSYAYTWKGEKICLGSISEFPLMHGSYQNSNWGLGWQSMPVSARIEDVHVSFLRIRTKVNEKEHCHPAVTKRDAFFSSRLFDDGNITVFTTTSAQEHNISVVVRSANNVANTASFICDEWCVPKGAEKIDSVKINGRTWYIVYYKDCAMALCPLDGIEYASETRNKMKTCVDTSGSFSTVSTMLYEGDEKLVFAQRLESAWAIVAIENLENVEDYIKSIKISDEVLEDYETSIWHFMKKRKIVCSDGIYCAELTVDPTAQKMH